MDLHYALAEVERQTALIEGHLAANRQWLTSGFLRDESFTPQAYVARAQLQRQLLRELVALIEPLTNTESLETVA